MDLITSAVVAAIEQGAPGHAPEPVSRYYQQLKTAIGKFDGAAVILAAITALEADSSSEPLRLALAQALSTARVGDDMASLFAAQSLLAQLRLPSATAEIMEANEKSGGVVSNYAVIKTFFATDRQRDLGKPPAQRFSGARNAPSAEQDTLSYGSCDISIPRDHRMGQLESPSLWRLEFRDDPAKHVVLLTADVQDADTFYAALSAQIAASAGKNAFLFIHGYNVTFEDAARRTGQMAYDLGFDGAPVFYSWPSQGDLSGYTVDENNIEWSTPHILGFLSDFLARTAAQNVFLIAHSMGSRGLTRAIAALMATQPLLAQKISEIILAAPDIDAAVFKNDIAPQLAQARNPVTLYASSDDLALAASKAVHGYARAGDSGPGMQIVAGVETIDATAVDTGFVKHMYFAEKRSALSDMFYLIHNQARADQRFLDPVDTPAGRYWMFRP